MRTSHLIIALAPLALAMTAGAAAAAGGAVLAADYHGAIGDGTIGTNNGTLNTSFIQAAINACAAQGGGIVAVAQPGAERQEPSI